MLYFIKSPLPLCYEDSQVHHQNPSVSSIRVSKFMHLLIFGKKLSPDRLSSIKRDKPQIIYISSERDTSQGMLQPRGVS